MPSSLDPWQSEQSDDNPERRQETHPRVPIGGVNELIYFRHG